MSVWCLDDCVEREGKDARDMIRAEPCQERGEEDPLVREVMMWLQFAHVQHKDFNQIKGMSLG